MTARTIIATLAGLLVVILIILVTPRMSFTAKGNALPAEKIFPATSADNVKIYNQAPQTYFTTLGTINAEIKFDTAVTDQTKAALFQKVKSLGATLGANGVIINILAPDNGVAHMLYFNGVAIYTARSKNS